MLIAIIIRISFSKKGMDKVRVVDRDKHVGTHHKIMYINDSSGLC